MFCAPCLVLDNESTTEAVTTVNGTAVCRSHVAGVAVQLRMPEVRQAAMEQIQGESQRPGRPRLD